VSKPIAVCADDFGLESGINEGIEALAQQRRLSAVSCMTTAPLFAGAIAALLPLDIDLGLHLNFTELSAAPEICLSLRKLLIKSYGGTLVASAVNREIHRQLDAFERYTGRKPDFVDGHEHVHQLPIIRDVLLMVLKERYPSESIWLRNTAPGDLSAKLPMMQRCKAHVIGALGARSLSEIAKKNGYSTNVDFFGVYDFSRPHPTYLEMLKAWLGRAVPGSLLMTHPATKVSAEDAYGRDRIIEYQVLGSNSFADLLTEYELTIDRLSNRDRLI